MEHDAAEIWDVTRRVAVEAIVDAGIQGVELDAIGITNQRETVVAWIRRPPLHNALVWQDRRTAARCDEPARRRPRGPRARAHRPRARPRLLRHQDRVAPAELRGRPRARGVRHDRLAARVQAHRSPRTDLSNAPCTLLFDIHQRRWDPDLCELLGVDPERLPRSAPVGARLRHHHRVRRRGLVAGIAGDQQAALFGQACHSAGQGKNTYGTGSFVPS